LDNLKAISIKEAYVGNEPNPLPNDDMDTELIHELVDAAIMIHGKKGKQICQPGSTSTESEENLISEVDEINKQPTTKKRIHFKNPYASSAKEVTPQKAPHDWVRRKKPILPTKQTGKKRIQYLKKQLIQCWLRSRISMQKKDWPNLKRLIQMLKKINTIT